MIASGPIFCQVVIMMIIGHANPFSTCGNQIWNGAMPSFIMSLAMINRVLMLLMDEEMNIINDVNKKIELAACTRKYLIVDSDS